MSDRVEAGVFLQRRSYRRRRFLDAMKILPILGAWLFMLPVLWTGETSDGTTRTTSHLLLFIFSGWIALIFLSSFFMMSSARLKDWDSKDPQESQTGGP